LAHDLADRLARHHHGRAVHPLYHRSHADHHAGTFRRAEEDGRMGAKPLRAPGAQ
jgi:hypothetical protein